MIKLKILDSSILIDLLRGEKEVEKLVAEEEEQLCSCFPVSCELYRGTKLARRTEEGRKEVKGLLEEMKTLEADDKSASHVAELRRKYTEISTFDLMIAGIAIRHSAEIITKDTDFQKIEELDAEII